MPPNLRVGGTYLVLRRGIVPCLFSLTLSCALLTTIFFLSARSFLTISLYTSSSPSLSVTSVALLDAAANHHSGLHESPVLQPLRVPGDVKTVFPENGTSATLVKDVADEGYVLAAAGTKQIIQILFTNGLDDSKVQVWNTVGGGASQLPTDKESVPPKAGSSWSTGRKSSEMGTNGSKKTKKFSSESTAGSGNISVADLWNWKGDLDGVDIRGALKKLTSKERRVWLQLNWANFKILQADSLSQQFASRLDAFLQGHEYNDGQETREEFTSGGAEEAVLRLKSLKKRLLGTEPQTSHPNMQKMGDSFTVRATGRQIKCKLRFFLTWISSISSFGPREHICLESIFSLHPTACVVILSRSLDTPDGRKILQPFVDRDLQVLAVSPDLPFLFKDTPAAEWFKLLKSGRQDPGDISLSQNLSNILRMAVLYKYGGIYLDHDVLLLRDLSGLHNIIGAQSADELTGQWTRLNNAVMIFERSSPVLLEFMQEFVLTYNGRKWGHNGPYLVTRVIKRLTGRAGYKFAIAAPSAFYPVNWEEIESFFRAPNTPEERMWQLAELEQVERESYALHLWNKASRNMDVQKQSLVDILSRKVCLFCETTLRNEVSRVDYLAGIGH